MKYRRIVSLALVGAVLLSTFGDGFPAQAAAIKGLELTYVADGTKTGDVIRGDAVEVKVSNKDNHSIKDEARGLKVFDNSNNTEDITNFSVTVNSKSPTVDTFKLKSNRLTPPNLDGDTAKFYGVSANYNALMKDATTKQTSGTSVNQVGIMTSSTGNGIPVSETSKGTLAFKTGSTFDFDYVAATAGVFNDWKTGTISAEEIVAGTSTVKQKFRLTFTQKNDQSIQFDFEPGSYQMVNVDPPALNPDGTTKQEKLYKMQDNTTFDILFTYISTPPIGLQVHNQLQVLKDVSKRGKEFLKMKNPTDEPMYITDTVELNGRFKQYGRDVELTWFSQMDGETTRTLIPGDQTKKTFFVTRKEDDTDGKLIVRATYVEPGFFDVELNPTDTAGKDRLTSIETEIPIRIKGTGIPTKTELQEFTTGKVTTTYLPGDPKRVLPNMFAMDKYTGNVPKYDPPSEPFTAKIWIDQGKKNAFPVNIKVSSTNPDVVSPILTKTGNTVPGFAFNTPFINDGNTGNPPPLTLQLNANKVGTTKLTFEYLVQGNGALVVDPKATKTMTITVKDTSPDETADLADFTIKNNGELIKFGFTPKKYNYDEIELPYKTKEITFEPTAFTTSQKDMSIKVEQMDDSAIWDPVSVDKVWKSPDMKWVDDLNDPTQLSSSIFTKQASTIKLVELVNRQLKITLKVRAQNPNMTNTYTFLLRQKPASDDSTLKTLELFDQEGVNHAPPLVAGKNDYEVNVPYSVAWLKPNVVPNQEGATFKYDPELVAQGDGIMAAIKAAVGNVEWIKAPVDSANPNAIIKQMIEVMPENNRAGDKRTYTLSIIHDKPSNDATLTGLTITDKLDADLTTLVKPGFAAAIGEYELNIPFATDELKILLKPGDKNAKMELLKPGEMVGNGIKMSQTVATRVQNIPVLTVDAETGDVPYILTLHVVAEDGTTKDYKLNVFRTPANKENALSALKLADKEGVQIAYEFATDVFSYDIEVLYAVDQVTLTPTPTYAGVKKITVDGRTVPIGEASRLIKLEEYPNVKKVEVVIFPEDETAPEGRYALNIKRAAPSSDAELKELTAGGADPLKPVWVPKNTNYTAVVLKDGKTVTVTATANNPYATITIDGKTVESGKASEPITLMSASQAVKIVVTAQDKKTTKTYVITFQNDNMVEKSSNADLLSLTINYGEMTPKFKPSTTLYEVSANEETFSVDILPVPADRLATMKVFAGTKEIGDHRGNFSQAIADGENDFSVEVLSPDGKVPKTYNISVYRNEEDKMGSLKPISPDEIDYEASDVIVVDISKYTRISADVFNELKKYPKKKIIFEGNDYSLQFEAKDLTKVIPSTTIYDFALSFTSPEEQAIYDLMDARKGNEYLRPVMIYFTHHGALPAPAQLNISLGRRYANRRQYWNYYNAERDRIDYYGYVDTNSRGTFTVTLDHFSTYISTSEKIIGAENKSAGDKAGEQNLSQAGSADKINPGTGVSEVRQ